MKAEILKMLRESGDYISGQQLCETLGVSRTAVWKVINQLKEEGYQVEAVRNKRYHIVDCPDVLSKEELQSRIDTTWAGQQVCYLSQTGSTNIEAKKLGEQGGLHGSLVVADMQNTGKGRRGKGWVSQPGTSIYFTILLRPEIEPSRAPMLTLVMAYSVASAIRETEGLDAQIKWPNDIVLNKKKVCGILTEMSAEIDYINHVVIGVGINVNMTAFPEELRETATSLRIESGKAIKRAGLIAAIMSAFEKNYGLFLESVDLSGIRDSYNEILVNCGREVCILSPGQEYRARAIGINDTGELVVEREDGTTEDIFSGEVSVRGIYGYV